MRGPYSGPSLCLQAWCATNPKTRAEDEGICRAPPAPDTRLSPRRSARRGSSTGIFFRRANTRYRPGTTSSHQRTRRCHHHYAPLTIDDNYLQLDIQGNKYYLLSNNCDVTNMSPRIDVGSLEASYVITKCKQWLKKKTKKRKRGKR